MGQWSGYRKQRMQDKARLLVSGLASVIGLGLFSASAEAVRLQSWRFNPIQNRLEFTTDETIQPRVQLIPNPVRLVVDLPGVKLAQPTINQSYSAAFRSIRVGQFDAQTTRIVVELAPGYTVDPQRVKVSGASPFSWSVDLPAPVIWQSSSDLPEAGSNPSSGSGGEEPLSNSANLPSAVPLITPPSVRPVVATFPRNNLLEDILVTPDGLFVKTQVAALGAEVRRSNSREITVDISGVLVANALTKNDYRMDYHGIQKVSVRQLSAQPPVARLTLRVDRKSPNWQASVSRLGGVLLLPQGGAAAVPKTHRPTESLSFIHGRLQAQTVSQSSLQSPNNPQLATVQSLALGGSQLLIQANRAVYYTTGWEGARYRITLRGAQAAPGLKAPQIGSGSALSNVSLRQDGQNLAILATPAPGVRIGIIGRVDAQTVVVNLDRNGVAAPPMAQQSFPTGPSIFSQPMLSQPTFSQPTLARPNGRRIVVIDPGHGGPDPGAVGIGGLRETDIVLQISLEVARLLQQQGLQVYLTRTDESRDVDLPPRVALAQRVRADVFVSIHANSINLSRPDINGTETYYAPGSASGAELSQTILNSITRSVNIPSRGLHSARFYVIRNTTMPATLVETGFVTGGQDAPKLANPTFQRQMAAAIAQGIIEFLNRR